MKLFTKFALLAKIALGGLFVINPSELKEKYAVEGQMQSKLSNLGLTSS